MADNKTSAAASSGIGFGAALAMIISWSLERDVLWTIIHGILGWLYVIWYIFWGTPAA